MARDVAAAEAVVDTVFHLKVINEDGNGDYDVDDEVGDCGPEVGDTERRWQRSAVQRIVMERNAMACGACRRSNMCGDVVC